MVIFHCSRGEYETAKSKFRMRTSNLMMAATVVACCYMIYLGKNLSKDDMLAQKNLVSMLLLLFDL